MRLMLELLRVCGGEMPHGYEVVCSPMSFPTCPFITSILTFLDGMMKLQNPTFKC